MRYVLSYDLISPGQNYQRLWDELASFGAKRVLQSQWVFSRVHTTAAGLRDPFRQFVDSNNRLLVTCLDSSDWAGWNLLTRINEI